jgi:ribonuclease HII
VARTPQSDPQTQLLPKEISPAAAKLRLLKSLRCTLRYEREGWRKGARMVGGVDEAGRGCLFGPVVAAAVILNPEDRIRGLRDSKLLPEETRERLAAQIRKRAICWAFASVDAAQIDVINILQASRLAMRNAVLQLQPEPDFLLVDAVRIDHSCEQRAIIHGDALSASIAAASIIAKVERDRMMRELDATYPQYALASNKGYGTPAHRSALLEFGPTPLHRMTFAPVRSSQEEFEFPDDFDDIADLMENPVHP